MTLKLPTSLGAPTMPQAGNIRRGIAQLNSGGLAEDLIRGSRIQGTAWHHTAAGLQDVGTAYDNLQLQSDQKETKDLINQFVTDKTKLLYGDGTPQNPGFMNSQGDAAVKGVKGTKEALDKLRQDYIGKASNRQVNSLFDVSSASLLQPDQEDILKHAGKEYFNSLDITDGATIDAFTNSFIANPVGPNAGQSLQMIEKSTLAILDRAGIVDPSVRATKVSEAKSKALSKAVSTAVYRDLDQGKALYGLYKGDIDGDQQLSIEQDIKTQENAKMAQAEHQQLMALRQQEITDNNAANAWADKWADPKTRAQVTPEAIAADRSLKGTTKLTFIDRLQRQTEEDGKTALAQAQTRSFADLSLRIRSDPKSVSDSQIMLSPLDDSLKGTLLNRKDEALKGNKNETRDLNEDMITNMWLRDPKSVTPDILASTDVSVSFKASMGQKIEEHKNKNPFNKDPGVFNNLLMRTQLPAGTPGAISSLTEILPYVGEGIDMDQANQLKTVMKDLGATGNEEEKTQIKALMDTAKGKLNMTIPGLGVDPDGPLQEAKFNSWFLQEYKRRKEAGEKPSDFLNPNNNKDSLYEGIKQYVRPRDQVMKSFFGDIGVGSIKEMTVDSPQGSTGEYGSLEALQAATRANAISVPDAYEYAKKKGWTVKTAPTVAAPTGQ